MKKKPLMTLVPGDEAPDGSGARLTLAEHVGRLLRLAEDRVTHAQLVDLSQLDQQVEEVAERGAHVARGMAVQLLSDEGKHTAVRSGSCQSGDDAAELLLHLSDSFTLITVLSRLAGDSAYVLRSREKPEHEGPGAGRLARGAA